MLLPSGVMGVRAIKFPSENNLVPLCTSTHIFTPLPQGLVVVSPKTMYRSWRSRPLLDLEPMSRKLKSNVRREVSIAEGCWIGAPAGSLKLEFC
jgi:hypothetical protein